MPFGIAGTAGYGSAEGEFGGLELPLEPGQDLSDGVMCLGQGVIELDGPIRGGIGLVLGLLLRNPIGGEAHQRIGD